MCRAKMIRTMDAAKGVPEKPQRTHPKWLWPLVTALGGMFALVALSVGFVYLMSPAAIRQPQMEHYHFRMQLVVNGKDIDFSKEPFQMPYAKGQCSGELSAEPIHFHDNKNQFVHIHWKEMTGGLVLKNYGWNMVGGLDAALGYRFDNLPKLAKVPIHGASLPAPPEGARFWVYTGDEKGYKARSFDDFTHKSLEDFFGKRSNFMTYESASKGLLAWFFPKAAAHDGHEHTNATSVEIEAERLTRINNLIGNVVIFVQKDEPSADQIKARFARLEPLSDSTCGG
jgi:hypothetical protein